MSYKLVIKGQSENAEFPAVDSAEIPRLALYDGTYIPLVEDDGSDGTTLKVRIDDKVYRIKNDTLWEVYFDFEFSSGGVYVGMLAAVDNNFNITAFNRTNNRAEFTAKLFKRASTERPIYSNKDGFFLGPVYADYTYASVPYAERSANTNIGSSGNSYVQAAFAEEKDFSSLPVEEIGFFWIHKLSQSMQSCIFRNNKTLAYWGNYSVNGIIGSLANLLCITAENVSSEWAGVIRNRVLFNGKVRIARFPVEGSSPADPSFTDYDASVPLEIAVTDPFMAFVIPDKNVSVPFETVITDARNSVQMLLDLFKKFSLAEYAGTAFTYRVQGEFLDVVSYFDTPMPNTVTVKKSATVIAINWTGPDYTANVVEANYSAGDTFTFDAYTTYTSVYPAAFLAFADSSSLPIEIAFKNTYNRNCYGYFYNTQTKHAELGHNGTGTYLRQNGYVTEKYVNFNGDLLVQPMGGQVEIIDGQSSWSANQFSGFAMVFLEKDSTLTVNTEPFDDVQAIDNTGTVVDEAVADEEGKATLAIPTTGVGRSYTVRSVYSGDETEVTASGDTAVTITPSSDLPDFELIWQYQYVQNTGMICGSPDTGLMFNALPSAEFSGKLLKQVYPSVYKKQFIIAGKPGGEYQVYQMIVTMTNMDGHKLCYAKQLGLNNSVVHHFFTTGDVRSTSSCPIRYVRPSAPFDNTSQWGYSSQYDISYFGVSASLIAPIYQEPPCKFVYEAADFYVNNAIVAAKAYFDSLPEYAVKAVEAEDVRYGDVGILGDYATYTKNAIVSQTFPARNAAYDRLIIARKDVKYPGCEMAFVWYTGGPTEACIVKQTNEHIPHATTMTGDFMTIANGTSITINQFDGVLKYKVGNDDMVTRDMSSSSLTIQLSNIMGLSCFFCYPNVPNKYVEYTAGFSESTLVRTTFKNAPKKSVTGAVGSGTSWNIWVLYDNNDTPSTAIVHDIDMKQGAGTWYNVRTNSSTNHDSSTTYNITGAGSIQGGMDAGDAQFTAGTFEELAQKVRQYFDSH